MLHRIGALEPGEPIVFVAAASAHRQAAFDACAFVMDYLKTRAPFWKKAPAKVRVGWTGATAATPRIMEVASRTPISKSAEIKCGRGLAIAVGQLANSATDTPLSGASPLHTFDRI